MLFTLALFSILNLMKRKAESSAKKNAVNFFGAFGYLFCLLQWFWAVMLYFSVVQSTTKFVAPEAGSGHIEQTSDFTLGLPDPLKWAVLIFVTVLMIAITAYVLIKMPMGIVKNSNKAVHKTAESVAPMIMRAQHKKITPKSRLKITARLILALKLLLVATPVILAVASGLLEKQFIDYSIATVVAYGVAALSAGAFAMQYVLAKLLRVPTQGLW